MSLLARGRQFVKSPKVPPATHQEPPQNHPGTPKRRQKRPKSPQGHPHDLPEPCWDLSENVKTRTLTPRVAFWAPGVTFCITPVAFWAPGGKKKTHTIKIRCGSRSTASPWARETCCFHSQLKVPSDANFIQLMWYKASSIPKHQQIICAMLESSKHMRPIDLNMLLGEISKK